MQHQQYTEEKDLLGSLCPGEKKLLGKTFYLDSVKKRSTALLLETIALLGGGVESFLHKDVSFVVTGNQECLKEQKCTDTKAGAKGTSEEAQHPIMRRESVLNNDKRRPGTPRPMACGSRGKALLEKAIRNNEQLQKSSVLANARSWGVKILFVDDVLLYLKQLTRESFSTIHKRPEKTYSKQGSHVVKAAALRSPHLKIEDVSRKYKPLHMQSMTFPTLWYSGRFSPFESPPPPFEKQTERVENKTREKKKNESSIQDKSQTPLSCNPSPWRPRKKDLSYCECCHQPFTNLEEHLQSDQHRAFVLDFSNYTAVDQLVAEMLPGFDPNPPQQSEETLNRPPTPLCIQDVCELEPLSDAETEHAIHALQRRSSSLNTHISSPTRGPVASGPGSPSPRVSFPLPNLATPPADIHPFTTDTDCQIPDSHPHALSPAMPEHAIQALQRQGSSLNTHISSPTRGPVASGPGSPSPGVSFPLPNPATPPADIHPFTTDTDCQIPDSHPHALSPAMPVLDVEPQAHDSASLQSDTQHLSPCPDKPCPSPDPYSLPPVLSPQVPYHSYIIESHSPYSEPPVLTPQRHTAEEAVEGHTCERNTAESVFQSVPAVTIPVSTPCPPPVALTIAERVKGSNLESLLELSDSICITNGLKCATLFSCSSHSLPQQSATTQNPKKRCRSARPEHNRSKRRRKSGKSVYNGSWNESVKPESDIMAKPEGCLSDKVSCKIIQSCPNPKISSTCAVCDLKQTFAMFCVPTVQNFSHAANQMDMLGHSSTSVSDQPSWPLSSKAKNFDVPHQFPSDKSHSAFSSRDSQCSLSHSTSVCIESALIPDLAMLSSSSSDSDWDWIRSHLRWR